ncbi:MAG: GNAT family N-acetyltransferase [Chloroflexi bacterium]|nr:GNAT family N-acetyltransferase [Chloroflexota bacterium]
MSPHFPAPLTRPICNFLTQETFTLVPLATNFCDPESYAQIVSICNQPLIYNTLFAERLGGHPYAQADAERFVAWAHQGWQAGTHFVFLILTPQQTIAGTIDIRSNCLASAEIGYWMSAEHPGVMTNAVKALCRIASQSGYRGLFALVREMNTKSAGVLLRAGFHEAGREERRNRAYRRFVLRLDPIGKGTCS